MAPQLHVHRSEQRSFEVRRIALTKSAPIPLSTLFEGLLVGLSIQARDGVSTMDLDAGVTQAMSAWDVNVSRK